MKTVFLRALEVTDKSATLLASIKQAKEAMGRQRFHVDPREFLSVPTSPFAYWVSPDIRKLFDQQSCFESQNPERRATKGLATTDDGQFLRVWWELQSRRVPGVWFSFAKGGPTSPFYADLSTYVLWENDGVRLKAYLDHKIGKSGQWSRWINSTNYYGRAGLTWALRARRFSPQALPKDSVFSVRGYAAFAEESELSFMLAVFNSSIFDYLFKLALGRFGHPEFVVGVLQWLPWVENGSSDVKSQLGRLASRAWELKRGIDTRRETSHAFVRPAVLQVPGTTLDARLAAWTDHIQSSEAELEMLQRQIDTLCFDLYRIKEPDRHVILHGLGDSPGGSIDAEAYRFSDASADADLETGIDSDLDEELDSPVDALNLETSEYRAVNGAGVCDWGRSAAVCRF